MLFVSFVGVNTSKQYIYHILKHTHKINVKNNNKIYFKIFKNLRFLKYKIAECWTLICNFCIGYIYPTPYNHIKNVVSASLNKTFPSFWLHVKYFGSIFNSVI